MTKILQLEQNASLKDLSTVVDNLETGYFRLDGDRYGQFYPYHGDITFEEFKAQLPAGTYVPRRYYLEVDGQFLVKTSEPGHDDYRLVFSDPTPADNTIVAHVPSVIADMLYQLSGLLLDDVELHFISDDEMYSHYLFEDDDKHRRFMVE